MDRYGRLGAAALGLLSSTAFVRAVPFEAQPRDLTSRAPGPVGGFSYLGCFSEPDGARALPMVVGDDGMTQEICASVCSGYHYFGVEYGRECWCGNELHDGTEEADEADCSFPCAGDDTQKCGAGMRLDLFVSSDWVAPDPPAARPLSSYEYLGCYIDTIAPRALPYVYADAAMTPELCATVCAGKPYIGLEYGQECWCGEQLDAGAEEVDATDCNMVCAGDGNALCGAGNRLTLYRSTKVPPTEPEDPTTPPTTPPTGDGTRVGDYLSQGCWTDAPARTLSELYADDAMTLEMCAGLAAASEYMYFGIEYGRECWMGNVLNPTSSSAAALTCDKGCSGDPTVKCGGDWRLNLYKYSPASSGPELDLSTAELTNAEFVEENGRTVIQFNVPPGGSASCEFPEGTIQAPDPTTPCTITLEYKAPEPQAPALPDKRSLEERATLTQCVLTIMMGGQVIYSGQIWSTDGTYTTVTTMAVSPTMVTSLIVTQYCPANGPSITIGDITIDPAPGASTTTTTPTTTVNSATEPPPSSTTAATENSSPTTTADPTTTTDPATVPTTTSSADPTIVPSTTAPQTTTAPTTTSTDSSTTAPPGVPTVQAPAYTSGACSYGSGQFYTNGCILSGAPVATSGLLAVATGIPATPPGSAFDPQYQQCARVCKATDGCESFALDRGGWPTDLSDFVCYLFSGNVYDYRSTYSSAYAKVVWFSTNCYECQDIPLPGSSSSAPATSSATTATTSSDLDGELPPTTTTSSTTTSDSTTTTALTTTSTSPSTTAPPSVATLQAPAYTSGVCGYGSGQFYTNGCVLSGAPVATSGLLAVATGIPATPPGGAFDPQYQQCARVCKATDGCESFALDRGGWPTDLSDFACYLFSGGVYDYRSTYSSAYARVVWFSTNCFACQDIPFPGSSSSAPATSSTTTATTSSDIDEELPLTTTTSSTTTSEITTTTGPITTTAPIPTYLAPAYTAGNCVFGMTVGPLPNQCTMSGWPRPTPTNSGLLAVATGITPPQPGNFNFSPYYAQCADVCGAIGSECQAFVLDRGSWPTDLSPWKCYFYSFDSRAYISSTNMDYPASAPLVWFADECLKCQPRDLLPVAEDSSTSAPTSTTTSTITTSSDTYTPSTTVSATTTTDTTITTAPTIPTFAATTFRSGRCVYPTQGRSQGLGCNISGYPMPTPTSSALLAVATGIPPWDPARWTTDQELVCAGHCADTPGCHGYVIDRGNWPVDMSPWTCYLYAFDGSQYLQANIPNASSIYRQYYWFDEKCYNCPAGPTSTSTTPSTTTTATPSETVTSDTTTSTVTGSTTTITTSDSASITTPPSTIATYNAALYSVSCGWNAANNGACTISGRPTATTSLIAVATNVVLPSPSQGFEAAYYKCQALCQGLVSGCRSFALDRTNPASYTCLFYSFSAPSYLQNAPYSSAYSAIVWFDPSCHTCAEVAMYPTTTSLSSSAGSGTTTSTTDPSTAPSGTITTASTVPTLSAEPLRQSCANPTNAFLMTEPCRISQYPTPTSGLMAVATGIPGTAQWLSADLQAQRCASMCDGNPLCKGYAIDRTDIGNWTCLFYDRDIRGIMDETLENYGPEWDTLVWYDTKCFDCLYATPWPPSPAATATSTGTPAAACTRPATVDEDLSCDVRGFSVPGRRFDHSISTATQADCAAWCARLKTYDPTFCESYMWVANSKTCGAWTGLSAWDALPDGTMAGPSFRYNVIEDFGCYECPEGASYRLGDGVVVY